MSAAGLRSLFRYHRQTTGVKLANPHRFRHYAGFRTIPGEFDFRAVGSTLTDIFPA
jgi:hypothetical protein